MKTAALIALFFLALPVYSKPREYKVATVIAVTSSEAGAAVVPIGSALVGARIYRTYYRVRCENIDYVLLLKGKHPLNITIHGQTKLSIEGRNAHVLDDAGKDVKLPIVQKIAVQ